MLLYNNFLVCFEFTSGKNQNEFWEKLDPVNSVVGAQPRIVIQSYFAKNETGV